MNHWLDKVAEKDAEASRLLCPSCGGKTYDVRRFYSKSVLTPYTFAWTTEDGVEGAWVTDVDCKECFRGITSLAGGMPIAYKPRQRAWRFVASALELYCAAYSHPGYSQDVVDELREMYLAQEQEYGTGSAMLVTCRHIAEVATAKGLNKR